ADQRFSTSHDYKIAKIIVYDLVQIYLENQLYKAVDRLRPTLLNWTGSKTALTELIYALYSRGVFDNGNTDIKHIAKYFEAVFNIDLGYFYHCYFELKNNCVVNSFRPCLRKIQIFSHFQIVQQVHYIIPKVPQFKNKVKP